MLESPLLTHEYCLAAETTPMSTISSSVCFSSISIRTPGLLLLLHSIHTQVDAGGGGSAALAPAAGFSVTHSVKFTPSVSFVDDAESLKKLADLANRSEIRWSCVAVASCVCGQSAPPAVEMDTFATRIVGCFTRLGGSKLSLVGKWRERVDVVSSSSDRTVLTQLMTKLVEGVAADSSNDDFGGLFLDVILAAGVDVKKVYTAMTSMNLDNIGMAFALPALLAKYVFVQYIVSHQDAGWLI